MEEKLSLQTNWNTEIPIEIAEVGRQILSQNNPYRLIGERVNDFLRLEDFEHIYSPLGRGAICPILLSLVTIFQSLENVPDRVAAEWVVTRLDWKYALHLPLTWSGFNFSDLSNFRKRLLKHHVEWLGFEKIVSWVRSLGFLKKHGKQRSDSTHILGNVERLSRLELAWETLRLSLRAIQETAPAWYAEVIPAAFHQAYVERHSDWRLSSAEVSVEKQKAGRDGYWLLDRLDSTAPGEVLALAEIVILRTVWKQQFERREDDRTVVIRGTVRGKDTLQTPHDADVRWAEKRGKDWRGYKLQVTETAEAGEAEQFLTDIDVTAANTGDSEVVDEIHERLIARGLKPDEHSVDRGYVSGANLAHSKQRGIELLGPTLANTSVKAIGYKQSDFHIDFESRRVTCPQGRLSAVWYERPQTDGRVGAEVQFRQQCQDCPVRHLCAPGKCGRTLFISPYHQEIVQRRAEQDTPSYQERMKRRSAIEGTISELTRKHGARRARYRGTGKMRLQALFIGAAINLKRLARALQMRQQVAARALVGS